MSSPDRDDWDENDWESFLRRADTRAAKYQELFETLVNHPDRDLLIAQEMGWESDLNKCGGSKAQCPMCDERFECEAYEMFLIMNDPDSLADDPDADDVLANFDQLQQVPAYTRAHDFVMSLMDRYDKLKRWGKDEDLREALFAAQMVPAQIAGGHGIGYERDALCGNIANCKRAMQNMQNCLAHLQRVVERSIIDANEAKAMLAEAEEVNIILSGWIEELRARVWWR